MAKAPLKPLITIVGATGTGKSDLAVDIARKFNGEVINGDTMQLYRGLPVITNKITVEEAKGVPHHLLGCIGLEEETWTVGKFVGEALSVIDEIRSRGKLPILVGGTHYYTQSLLFQDALADEPALNLNEGSESFPVLEEPTDVLLAKLKEVDPVMAERWHPNERRKIQRSLEIYLRTGKPASQLYNEQRVKRGTSPSTGDGAAAQSSLRFNTLVFWVHANKDVLHKRLNARVDKMITRGLLSEVHELSTFAKNHQSATGSVLDQTRGIWVSIGYKEFLEYQTAQSNTSTSEADLQKLKTAAIEKTQAATRQYANRQLKWLRIKLLNALHSAGSQPRAFLVDGTDLSTWHANVLDPATCITSHFLAAQPLPDPTSLSAAAAEMLTPKREYDLGQRPDLWQKRVCETCGTVAVTENDWGLHVRSRGHRRAVGVEKKRRGVGERRLKDAQADVVGVLEEYLGGFEGGRD